MRGTTPTHVFSLPFNVSMVAKAKVTYKYGNTVLLKKHTADCKMEGSDISVTLTRAETVNFPDNCNVKVQLEIETVSGESLKTPVYTRFSSELLDEEELQ